MNTRRNCTCFYMIRNSVMKELNYFNSNIESLIRCIMVFESLLLIELKIYNSERFSWNDHTPSFFYIIIDSFIIFISKLCVLSRLILPNYCVLYPTKCPFWDMKCLSVRGERVEFWMPSIWKTEVSVAF